MSKDLILSVEHGSLNDHLMLSHIPRIAKGIAPNGTKAQAHTGGGVR